MAETVREPERRAVFVLTRFEKWALPRLAAGLPGWVLPDHLTLLGIVAATGIACAYGLSNHDPRWLWAASVLLIVHWFGDSLDGTLARVRHTERPRYGFYLDHLTDAYSTVAVGLGLGLSPYMLLSTGLAIVIAYLVLSINVYLETHAFGVFRYGYGVAGPTEARLVLIVLNTLVATTDALRFTIAGVHFTSLDVAGWAAALSMTALLSTRVTRNLRTLALAEPANTRREP